MNRKERNDYGTPARTINKMKLENGIGWCDATTNAVTGCTEVSPGCARCYAKVGTRARVLRAQGKETWGAKGERVPVNFEPVFRRLNKLQICDECHETAPVVMIEKRCNAKPHGERGAFCNGRLRRIRLFADSNSDWLDSKWPVETLARFLDAIRLAPNVNTLLLTKRIENFKPMMELLWDHYQCRPVEERAATEWLGRWLDGEPPSHVWLGVSVENQKCADDRIPKLLKTPAAVRFLSAEPLLEELDLTSVGPNSRKANERRGTGCTGEFVCNPLEGAAPYYRESDGEPCVGDIASIDWVIVGGESGKNRRACDVRAIECVVEQCVHADVPVYVKQDSAFASGRKGRLSDVFWKRKEFPR